jgi:hypothetical protein
MSMQKKGVGLDMFEYSDKINSNLKAKLIQRSWGNWPCEASATDLLDEAQYFFTKSVAEASQGQFPQLLWISFAFK